MTNSSYYLGYPLLHDLNHILEPRPLALSALPNISMLTASHSSSGYMQSETMYRMSQVAKNLIHAVKGSVTMKMLMVYADGKEHHWDEINPMIGIPIGNDIDCWHSLINRHLIAFSSKHKRGRKFYTITPFGRDVLKIIEENNVFYRVARWFKLKGDIYSKLLTADISGDDSPVVDLTPENFLALAKAMLDPSSELYKIGSVYKWMNSFVALTKTSRDFYEQFYTPEVVDWITNAPYPPAKKFLAIFKKAKKKWEKKLKADAI